MKLRLSNKLNKYYKLFLNHKYLIIVFVIFIFILSLFVRIIFLDKVPSGITNDEMTYLLNAKSVFLSGSDMSHTWNPLSLTIPKSGNYQAEIPPLITFWLIGPLPFSMFTSKLIYALFGAGTVSLLFLITKKLIGYKEAFIVGLVGTFNPWLIFFSRSAYDTSLAIFFFLLCFYCLLIFKGWKILLAFLPLFIAFFSYVGTKLILLPFALVTIIYVWYQNKKDWKMYLLLFIFCIALVGYYTFSILHASKSRINELATPNTQSIVTLVNRERRLSINTPLTSIFSNKYVLFGKYSLEKYLNAFSPSFLFLNGDAKGEFTVWSHGVFYYFDVVFLILGLYIMFLKKRKVFYILLAIIFVSPIPSVLSIVGNSYAIRSMLLAPMFIIFIGYGISYALNKHFFVKYLIFGLYIILILNFFYIYFLRNPIYNSESFTFSGRVLAKYLSFKSGEVYVLTKSSRIPYEQYLFYNSILNAKTMNKIASEFRNKTFLIDNIHFLECDQINEIPARSIIIYGECSNIPSSHKDLVIARLEDSGRIFTIHNDIVCSRYSIGPYIKEISFSDLNVEKLSEKFFCEKFIIRYLYNNDSDYILDEK